MSRSIDFDPHAHLAEGFSLEAAEGGILSTLPPERRDHPYDAIARMYDMVVGNPVYNRVIWGNWPRAYAEFARRALEETEGPFLDAGCGSLVFTSGVYADLHRPAVLLDGSLGMLRRARRRLTPPKGDSPGGPVLVQSDIRDLPFRADSFGACAAWGMLHLFEQPEETVSGLLRLAPVVYFTALVRNGRRGDAVLRALHRKGEAADPRSGEELSDALWNAGAVEDFGVAGNMAFGVVRREASQRQG